MSHKGIMSTKAKEKYFEWKRISGGFTFFPYQLAMGISFKYLSCISSLMVRIYFLMFKLWVNINLGGKDDGTPIHRTRNRA